MNKQGVDKDEGIDDSFKVGQQDADVRAGL